MKFKIGDKVRVKQDLITDEFYGGLYFAEEMEKYRGKVGTIKELFNKDGSVCFIKFDDYPNDYVDDWLWNESMFDKATNEEFIKDVKKELNSNFGINSVNHPKHYSGEHECIDVMKAMFGIEAVKHFCMCNAYKYRFRADRKNGDEDIKKAEWYEDYLIKINDEVKE